MCVYVTPDTYMCICYSGHICVYLLLQTHMSVCMCILRTRMHVHVTLPGYVSECYSGHLYFSCYSSRYTRVLNYSGHERVYITPDTYVYVTTNTYMYVTPDMHAYVYATPDTYVYMLLRKCMHVRVCYSGHIEYSCIKLIKFKHKINQPTDRPCTYATSHTPPNGSNHDKFTNLPTRQPDRPTHIHLDDC